MSVNANPRDWTGSDHREPAEIPLAFVPDLKEASKGAITKWSCILGDRVFPRKIMK